MDVNEYAAARRLTLIRAAVLWGCPELRADELVQRALTSAARSWRGVERTDDPDVVAFRSLHDAWHDQTSRARRSAARGVDNADGARQAVRQTLDRMTPEARETVVLRRYVALTEDQVCDVLGHRPALIRSRDSEAVALLAAGTAASGAPTEHDHEAHVELATELLRAAAESITLPQLSSATVPTPAPRRVPIAAVVAAAVLALAGVAYVATPHRGGGGEPPAINPTPRPNPALLTPWDSAALAADQVPSVFGYDAASARELLESRDLEVDVRTEPTCGADARAVRTSPAVGSRFSAGDVVTLVVSRKSVSAGSCPLPDPRIWSFLDFAAGRSRPPAFATNVSVSVNGVTADLSDREAADTASWPACSPDLSRCPGTAADVVAAAAGRVRELESDRYAQPTLRADSTSLTDTFTIDFPTDGPEAYPQWRVTLNWRSVDQGRSQVLAGVNLSWLESPNSQATPDAVVPSVTALPLVLARAELRRAELTVAEEQIGGVTLGCWRGYFVLAQNPPPGTGLAPGATVVLTTRLLPCGADSNDPVGLGQAFAAWVRGQGPPPAFADQVGLYVGNRRLATVPGSRLVRDPTAWRVELAGYAGRGPSFSARDVLATYDGELAFSLTSHTGPPCPDAVEESVVGTGGSWTQVISAGGSGACQDAVEIQLWVDAGDEIVAVNLLLGSP